MWLICFIIDGMHLLMLLYSVKQLELRLLFVGMVYEMMVLKPKAGLNYQIDPDYQLPILT